MIIDTSALMAMLLVESQWEKIHEALTDEEAHIPAPALTEFGIVAAGHRREQDARALIADLIDDGLGVVAFTEAHAALTWHARAQYGKGNGTGGQLNLLDLMVYSVAQARGEPLLCTGKDFATTDIVIHPASRPW